jgi:hypothetical protein
VRLGRHTCSRATTAWPSVFEVEVAIENLKWHKLPGIDQIPAELFKARCRTICSEIINLLILFGIRRNCLRSERSRTLYLFIRRAIKQIVVIIEAYHFCQTRTKFFPTFPAVKVNSICSGNYWGLSMWISTRQANYWSYILHSSNTWGKMGI